MSTSPSVSTDADVVLTSGQMDQYAERGFLSLGAISSAACPLPPGGATVHAGRTLHYAGPNHTDEPRRALIMAFRAPPVWQGTRTFPWQPAAWYA